MCMGFAFFILLFLGYWDWGTRHATEGVSLTCTGNMGGLGRTFLIDCWVWVCILMVVAVTQSMNQSFLSTTNHSPVPSKCLAVYLCAHCTLPSLLLGLVSCPGTPSTRL